MEKKLNLDVLSGMNFPEIKVEEEPITAQDINDIKDQVVQEVNSLDDFMADAPEDIKEQAGVKEPVVPKESKEPEDKTPQEAITAPLKEDPKTNEEEPSIIKGLADWAKSEQFFDYTDEEFQDSPDFLKGKFSEYADKKVQEKLSEYPEIIHELAKNFKAGVPLDELIYSKSREIEYSTLTEESVKKDTDLQKKLVIERLVESGYSEEQAEKKVKKYQDALILEDEGVEALGWLQNFEKKYQESLKAEAAQRAEKAQKEREANLKLIQNEIMGSSEFIPGIPVTDEDKKKIFEAYTKLDKDGKTDLIKAIEADPKAWAKITQFLVLEGGKLENIEKKLKTTVSKEVREKVSTSPEKNSSIKVDVKAIKKWYEKQKR